jgi:hypothetical protein
MVRLYPAPAAASRVPADQRTELFEHAFILLQCIRHLFFGAPCVRVETLRLGPQFFLHGRLERFFIESRDDFGVPRAEPGKTRGAESRVSGVDISFQLPAFSFQLPAFSFQLFGFRGFSGFARFDGLARFNGFIWFNWFNGFREFRGFRTTGNWRLETGNWRLGAGSWRLEAGYWQLRSPISAIAASTGLRLR